MLSDPKFPPINPVMRAIIAITGGSGGLTRIDRGIYDGAGFNFRHFLNQRQWEDFLDDEPGPCPSYGVADSIDQWRSLYEAKVEADAHEYCVGFTEVRRAEQPLEGGWRWHKWGEYVGTREPQCEYLHDEPEIESVVTFAVMRRKNGR